MELLYFILGFCFASFGIPIVEGICAWFLTWVEAKKAKQTDAVNQINIKMRKEAASAGQDEPHMAKIGFQIPDADEEESEDDEDEV